MTEFFSAFLALWLICGCANDGMLAAKCQQNTTAFCAQLDTNDHLILIAGGAYAFGMTLQKNLK